MSVSKPQDLNLPVTASNRGLFRPESLEARQMVWLGRPAITVGLPASLTGIASILIAVAALALVAFGSYARRIDLHGLMLPAAGLIEVSSPAAGWVQSMKVRDGQSVSTGTPLYVVNTDTSNTSGGTQQQILQALGNQRAILVYQIARRVSLRNQQDAQLQVKIQNLQAQVQEMDAEVAMKEDFARTVTKNYVDVTRYLQRGIGSLDQKLTQQQNWMRIRDELEELKGGVLRLRGQLNESQYLLATNDLQADNEIDAMRAKIADLDQQVANSRTKHSIEIHAPGDGTVTAIASHPGQTVASGARMLTIVPANQKVQAQLLAPSTSIGFIRPGERVLLRYSAFPYQRFGEYHGTVTEVSHAALLPDELKSLVPNLLPADQSKTFYRVIVSPDRQDVTVYGRPQALEASMQVDASVLLERRPLYEWILQPLYDLRAN
jgi:membrane fusion protein